MYFNLDRGLPTPLVQQLTEQLQAWITRQRLRPGARLPSIRTLAKAQAVSASCVIEAYDRLVASGWLEARHGAGFFVAERKPGLRPDPGEPWGEAIDGSWRQFREGHEQLLKLGCGWLPVAWRAEAELAQAIRQVSRGAPEALFDYCPPQGLASLRLQLHKGLARLDIAAEPERIVTTQGASHALDLLVRTLLAPGDTVLVERPGYYNLYNLLRLHGVRMLEVPRTASGPDLAVLEQLLAEHRPRCLFINSLYQNPTGTSLTPKVAYRLLELARGHDLRIVEDDLYADFQDGPATRLATLDSEQRVIYLGSFSKTLSSSLRVGYVVADPPLGASGRVEDDRGHRHLALRRAGGRADACQRQLPQERAAPAAAPGPAPGEDAGAAGGLRLGGILRTRRRHVRLGAGTGARLRRTGAACAGSRGVACPGQCLRSAGPGQ